MDYTPSREDYLIAVYLLQKNRGVVYSIDIVEMLGYSKPSVSNGVKLLRDNGLLTMATDKALCLTPEGERQAEKIYRRYLTVMDFLTKVLGVSEATAYQDTCRMEHFISDETCRKMQVYLDRRTRPANNSVTGQR